MSEFMSIYKTGATYLSNTCIYPSLWLRNCIVHHKDNFSPSSFHFQRATRRECNLAVSSTYQHTIQMVLLMEKQTSKYQWLENAVNIGRQAFRFFSTITRNCYYITTMRFFEDKHGQISVGNWKILIKRSKFITQIRF